jgi:hypothetical protein
MTQGLTLTKCILILVILVILVILLVSSMGRCPCLPNRVRCLGNAKHMFASVRTYAAAWDGWTHPDPDYYVKLWQYPLSSEAPPAGQYNAAQARLVKDFRCPSDKCPRLNAHGYYSSYRFLLPGCRLTDIQNPEKTPAVVEVGRRHPSDGVSGGYRSSFSVVFADGHAIMATPEDGLNMPQAYVPGMRCITWYTTTPSALFNALKAMPDLDTSNTTLQAAKPARERTLATGCLSYDGDDWAWIAEDWKDPDGKKRVVANEEHEVPANCVIRWEGYWKVPQDGTNPKSPIRLRGDWFEPQKGWLWLDVNDNNTIDPKETLADQTVTLEAGRKYRLVVLWSNENSNFSRARVLWHYDRPEEANRWRSLSYAECSHEPGVTYDDGQSR